MLHREVVVTSIYKLAVDKAALEAAFEVRRQVFVEEQGISRQLEFPGVDSEALHVVVVNGGKRHRCGTSSFPRQ